MIKFKQFISMVLVLMLSTTVMPFTVLASEGQYVYYAVLKDNFDDGTSVKNWKPSLCPSPEFVTESGRGKVAGIKYIKKKATAASDIKLTGLKEHMTGTTNYISLDMKPVVARNYAVTMPAESSETPLSLIISSNGWIWATSDSITNTAPSEVSKSFDEIKVLKGNEAAKWSVNEWHNIKFIIDKNNKKMMVYADNVCLKTVSTDISFDSLVIKNISVVDEKETENSLFIDNFEVGYANSANEPANITKLEITDDGILEIIFDKSVKVDTLNSDTVKISSGDTYIDFENPQYDDTLKKWTARIACYSYIKEYKVTVSGAKGISGNDVNNFEKIFKGSDTIFFPELYDTFDDGTSSRDWTPQWSRISYIEEDGRGYVMGMRYAGKVAETSTDVNVKNLSLADFDENYAYVSLDLKATVLRDYSFILKSKTSKNLTCITTSTNGWLYVHHDNVTQKGPNNDDSVFTKTMQSAVSSFGEDKVREWKKDVWYNIVFFVDKSKGTVSLYIDDELVTTVETGFAKEDMGIDVLNIKMHSAAAAWDLPGNESLRADNFQVGSYSKIEGDIPETVRSIKAIPIEGDSILSGTSEKITRKLKGFKVTTYDGIEKSTIGNIKVLYNDKEIDYDYILEEKNVVFIKPVTLPKNGDKIKITVDGLKCRSGAEIDFCTGSFMAYEEDLFLITGFKKSEDDNEIYPSGFIVNTTNKDRSIIVTASGFKKNAQDKEVMTGLNFESITVSANTIVELGKERKIPLTGDFDTLTLAVLDGNNYCPIEVLE